MTLATMVFRTLKASMALIGLAALPVLADLPEGWMAAGSAPGDYDFSIDHGIAAEGAASATIKAKPGAAEGKFGTFTQVVAADAYRSQRVRLSAAMRTDQASSAQLWLRVDGQPGKPALAFDNMDSRPVRGSTEWKRYEIVLDVPQESTALVFGFFLSGGKGQAWADSFRLEKVGLDVPVTGSSAGPQMRQTPINLNFD